MKLKINKFFLVALVLLPISAFPYVLKPIKWSNARATMYIATNSFPPGTWHEQAIQRALNRWNDIKGCGFVFSSGTDTDGTYNLTNGKNEVFIDNINGFATGDIAVTMTTSSGSTIIETDIGFNPYYTWIDYSGNQATTVYSDPSKVEYFEHVILHELGHVIGLKHQDNVLGTMNTYKLSGGDFGNLKEWNVHGDDRNGCRAIYPDSTTETDMVASKYYLLNGSAIPISYPRYWSRGQTLNIQFTAENLSTSTKTYTVGFYLSTNSYISQSDILIGTRVLTQSKGGTGTYSQSLTIPTNISAGDYYIGFIVDNANQHSETSESNNAVALKYQLHIN